MILYCIFNLKILLIYVVFKKDFNSVLKSYTKDPKSNRSGTMAVGIDLDKVASRFYRQYKNVHDDFINCITGLKDKEEKSIFSSIILNRLMITYFLQRKKLLDGNSSYLKDKFNNYKDSSFYKSFLTKLFFDGFNTKKLNRNKHITEIIGEIPYLDGWMFSPHKIEKQNKDLDIKNQIFEDIISFFENFEWRLNEKNVTKKNQITPKIMGYIFEKYINQKEKGAYYTKSDITNYITHYTVLVSLLKKIHKKSPAIFDNNSIFWTQLKSNPQKYIRSTLYKNVEDNYLQTELYDNPYKLNWISYADEEVSITNIETWKELAIRYNKYRNIKNKINNKDNLKIKDLIKYNIDIKKLISDVIRADNKFTKELLLALHGGNNNGPFTVLDPACGSGAFLFTALDILEFIFKKCINKLEKLNKESKTRKEVDNILKEVEKSDNKEYYIVKYLVLNNIYGVDIMEEATVIAKMRFFLRLISIIESSDKIEPLPDIDFNILSGNSLVGYTSLENVSSDESYLQLFRKQQNKKKNIIDKKKFSKRLDYLLWQDCNFEEEFEEWVESHEPFHWCIRFYEIIEDQGGFDSVIGNPPYVEYYQVRDKYKIHNYKTRKCNNLSAFITERSFDLLKDSGHIGLINPISIISTPRMEPLRSLIINNSKYTFFSNFADRPGTLFRGVHQKLTIFISQKNCNLSCGDGEIFTTNYYHWYSGNNKDERANLFDNIKYTKNEISKETPGFILKLGNNIDKIIWNKIQQKNNNLCNILSKEKSDYGISLAMRMTFWPKCFLRSKDSNEFKRYYLDTEENQKVIMAVLNSSLFYYYWELISDCWHITNKELEWFKIDLENMDRNIKSKLARLSVKLEEDLEIKKREISSAQTKYEYLHKKSKIIIDNIDNVLSEHYNLKAKELDYVKTYNIKYRMTDELKNYVGKVTDGFNNKQKIELK